MAVTKTALQFLLRVVSIGLATSLRQLINGALGYVFLGKGVFRVDRLERRSAAAYALVSPLPVISYGLQMRFVSRSLLVWRGRCRPTLGCSAPRGWGKKGWCSVSSMGS